MRRASGSPSAGFTDRGSGKSPVTSRCSVALGLGASKGNRPVQSQYRMVPSEKTSDCSLASLPSTTSGAMWLGDPTMAPVMVIRSSWERMRAIPKSASFTDGLPPNSAIITFSGFRSRWMTPAA